MAQHDEVLEFLKRNAQKDQSQKACSVTGKWSASGETECVCFDAKAERFTRGKTCDPRRQRATTEAKLLGGGRRTPQKVTRKRKARKPQKKAASGYVEIKTPMRTAMEGRYSKNETVVEYDPYTGKKLPCECSYRWGENRVFGDAYWYSCSCPKDDSPRGMGMAVSELNAVDLIVVAARERTSGHWDRGTWVPPGWTYDQVQARYKRANQKYPPGEQKYDGLSVREVHDRDWAIVSAHPLGRK